MRFIFLLLISGCTFITDSEHATRLDPDNDGVFWPNDCDDNDPTVGICGDSGRNDTATDTATDDSGYIGSSNSRAAMGWRALTTANPYITATAYADNATQ